MILNVMVIMMVMMMVWWWWLLRLLTMTIPMIVVELMMTLLQNHSLPRENITNPPLLPTRPPHHPSRYKDKGQKWLITEACLATFCKVAPLAPLSHTRLPPVTLSPHLQVLQDCAVDGGARDTAGTTHIK